jgi:Cohesin domain
MIVRLILPLILSGVIVFGATVTAVTPQPFFKTGASVPIDISISNVSDLFAFQFDLSFDPSVLSAESVAEGPYFVSNGVSFSSGTIDNSAGTITFIADTLGGSGPGFFGSTLLATATFKALAAGSTDVSPINLVLLDSSLSDIAANTSATPVTITSTPEPASMWLLGGGLCAGFISGLASTLKGPAGRTKLSRDGT